MKMIMTALVLVSATAFANEPAKTAPTAPAAAATTAPAATTAAPATATAAPAKATEAKAKVDCKDAKNKTAPECTKKH